MKHPETWPLPIQIGTVILAVVTAPVWAPIGLALGILYFLLIVWPRVLFWEHTAAHYSGGGLDADWHDEEIGPFHRRNPETCSLCKNNIEQSLEVEA